MQKGEPADDDMHDDMQEGQPSEDYMQLDDDMQERLPREAEVSDLDMTHWFTVYCIHIYYASEYFDLIVIFYTYFSTSTSRLKHDRH